MLRSVRNQWNTHCSTFDLNKPLTQLNVEVVSNCMQMCIFLFQSLCFAGASSEERPAVPDGGTNLSPQQLALLALLPGLRQQVQQAAPPTPKKAEETVSALTKPPEFSRPNSLLMLLPQKKDGGKQTQLNASPPKQLKSNEATSNKPAASGEMPVFPPRSPQSTSTPKP